ncbi:DEAD-box ATP-dependent DNA helicase Fancm [Drosophila tropicalis]|uniref:DEAD-box ATP-dependent DNA helicase Fancm n=1 Tax=Drosophila tropicalis TaxID=46794 RepID=UPI0035AB742F
MDWPEDDEELEAALQLQELVESSQQPTKEETQPETSGAGPSISTDCHGFDVSLGKSWIYPSNFPLRTYQQNIVQTALYKNTLVVLPTGLGKTFIAAVLMYNYYRWYPKGKIIFMAPTRPLVSQQIAACQKIMPFTDQETVELTGRLPRVKRMELWRTKRVFFATPQVVHSDMLDQTDQSHSFPFGSVKLLVVDEAHRAKGRYAYTQVTESLIAHNPQFRMLALSATPGRTMEDVAAVCRNLYISNLAVRWENSIDVQPYIHKRTIRTILVSLKDRIKEPRERLLQIIEPYLRQLIQAEVLKGARGNITKNNLLYDQKVFIERSSVQGQRHPDHNLIACNFSMCISLYHSLELLERHGLRVFVNNFDVDADGRDKYVLTKDADLRNLVDELRKDLGANPLDISTKAMTNGQVAAMPTALDFGHPKYEEVRKVLVNHFESHSDSRAIVFCEYRESVMLIQRLLLQHRPLLRPRCFVGQGGSNGGFYALTQKQQLAIMADFRAGTSNILVATSIGEEGIDVGEVEMIVCFDICSSNPTRFVQRIGRTGRKKNGQVVMLATEGREQQMLKDVLANREQTNRKMLNSSVVMRSLYEQNPRMIPQQLHPKCEEKFMKPPDPEPQTVVSPSAAKKRKTVKSGDLRKFFKQTSTSTQEDMLIGQQPYEMSEASQCLIKEQITRRSLTVKNFLLDTQSDSTSNPIPTPVSAPISNSQEDIPRLRKLTRFLQTSKPINPDLFNQLQDKQLPQSLKIFLLQNNPQFVQDICMKMQTQNALQLPPERLNSRQQKTRKNYELLLSICQDNIEQLLPPTQDYPVELTLKDLVNSADEVNEREFEAACQEIFDGLPEQGLLTDNYELRQQLMDKLELRNLEETVKETSWFEDEDVEEEQSSKLIEQSSLYQSQWQEFDALAKPPHQSTPLRSQSKPLGLEAPNLSKVDRFTPLRTKTKVAMGLEETDLSRVEASDLSVNLDRLNDLISGPNANPIAAETPQITPDDLELDLNDFLEPMPEEQDLMTQQKKEESILDLDLNDFLEPMAEERDLMTHQKQKETQLNFAKKVKLKPEQSTTLSLKENLLPTAQRSNSPDLFADESLSPCKPTLKKSLAAKLAAKSHKLITPPLPKSPDRRQMSNPNGQEKSPSIFDLYLQRTRGRGPRLAKPANILHKLNSNLPGQPEPDDSPIIQKRQLKRKIIISSDEDEEQPISHTQVIPATQIPSTPPSPMPSRPRFKRRKPNSFILDEVDLSGSDHEDEDAEETIGAYIKNTVIVSSDEDDNHNDTNVHAMYLQAVRSPLQRPGAFKMPAQRVYQDESYIYSQPVDEPSQYMPCSFIVDEVNDTTATNSHDISECPLERAERILKEQRKQRRQQRRNGPDPPTAAVVRETTVKRRRIQTYNLDSSDEQ